MKKQNFVSLAAGSALAAIVLSPVAQATDNPFGATRLQTGYQLAQADTKMKDASCGGDKKMDAKCGADKKAAAEKKKDGKCGEAKCGADKKKAEAKCGADKKSDASCGAKK